MALPVYLIGQLMGVVEPWQDGKGDGNVQIEKLPRPGDAEPDIIDDQRNSCIAGGTATAFRIRSECACEPVYTQDGTCKDGTAPGKELSSFHGTLRHVSFRLS